MWARRTMTKWCRLLSCRCVHRVAASSFDPLCPLLHGLRSVSPSLAGGGEYDRCVCATSASSESDDEDAGAGPRERYDGRDEAEAGRESGSGTEDGSADEDLPSERTVISARPICDDGGTVRVSFTSAGKGRGQEPRLTSSRERVDGSVLYASGCCDMYFLLTALASTSLCVFSARRSSSARICSGNPLTFFLRGSRSCPPDLTRTWGATSVQ